MVDDHSVLDNSRFLFNASLLSNDFCKSSSPPCLLNYFNTHLVSSFSPSKPETFSIKFLLFNARSLNNKNSFLHNFLNSRKDTIICITETWLCHDIPNSLLVGNTDFIVFRDDRVKSKKKTKGGGVCIFIPKHFCFTIKQTPPIKLIEYLSIDIFFGPACFNITIAYLPPDLKVNSVRDFCDSYLSLKANSSVPALLLGDFNLPFINWENLKVTKNRDKEITFLNFIASANLKNHILQPTRKKNILDLVITDSLINISDVMIEPPFLQTDHNIVSFSVIIPQKPPEPVPHSFKNFKNANFLAMNFYFLNYEWQFLKSKTKPNLESAYSEFTEVLNKAISLFVKTISPSSSENLPPKIQKMIEYRNLIFSKTPHLKKISIISKRINTLSIKVKREKEKNILKKQGVNGIFKHLSKFLKDDTSIPALKNNESTVFSDNEKVSLFAENFLTYFHKEKSNLSETSSPILDNSLPFLSYTQTLELLKKLKPKCNTSPDNIPYIVLQKCAVTLAKPIAKLINLSFHTGKVPEIWKLAHVVPIFKKGDRHFPANYRPISLNCSLSALPQAIIIEKLTAFFTENNLVTPCQHGFTKSKSVLTQLLETFDYVFNMADKGWPVDIIYFDFKKAFDRLKHSILLKKLRNAKVPPSIVAWIEAFLTDRKFRVKIGETLSDPFDVNSGVPQGSKLGPLLFSFFIADLIAFCKTDGVLVKLFADDLKIFSAMLKHLNSPLHKFLIKLQIWVAENCLEVATEKCNVLHVLPNKNPKVSYFFNGFKLPNNETSVRDLGITISDDLSWEKHIKTISKKALCRLFILSKALKTNSPKLFLHMYTTYVRPHLEFSTPLFNPHMVKHKIMLEKVQKVAVKIIFLRSKNLRPLLSYSYDDKLKLLGLESLESRRNHTDLTFFNDFLCDRAKLKLNLTTRKSKTRGINKKIILPKYKTDIKKTFFTFRVASRYIKLPRKIHFANAQTFKSELRALEL